MSYDDTLEQLGETVAQQLAGLHAQYAAGALALEDFTALGAVLMDVANLEAGAVGRLSFLAWLRDALGTDVAATAFTTATGLALTAGDRTRLEKALTTTLERADDTDPAGRLRRLARAETADAGHTAYRREFDAHDAATGWRRGLNADACQLCQWWARDGRTWPKDHAMPRHKGCTCVEVPMIGEDE